MTEPTRKKHTGEAGNPGEFGTHARTPDDTKLVAVERSFVNISTEVELQRHEPLPEWPSTIEQPDVLLDFNDGIVVHFNFPETDFQLHTWVAVDGVENSIDDLGGSWPSGWSEEETAQVTEWVHAVTGNVDGDVYGITLNGSLGVASRIIANATGRDDVAEQVIADTAIARPEPQLTPAQEAVARVRRTLPGWQGDSGVDTETQTAQAIADLIHFAKAEGYDFGALLDQAKLYVEDETDD